jgi:hypothetical protein
VLAEAGLCSGPPGSGTKIDALELEEGAPSTSGLAARELSTGPVEALWSRAPQSDEEPLLPLAAGTKACAVCPMQHLQE